MRVTTIKDVAQAAGVSVATVSRAMNGRSNVTPSTRDRILVIAREMRFTPSSAARSLIMRRTHTVGALLPDLYGEYFSELIRGMDLRARAHGLHLLVSSSHGNAAEADSALRAMLGRVDGLVVMSPHVDSASLESSLPRRLPAVLLNTQFNGSTLPSFSVDNYNGALAMTRHLRSLGHRSIAFIAGSEDNREATERLRGYRAGVAEKNGDAVADQVLPGDFGEESGWRAGEAIAAMFPRPDAVFASNDMMAIGCLAALVAAGLRVPQDVALAGFDDIPIARYLTPALTTVRVHIADMGSKALDQLAAIIESSDGGSTDEDESTPAANVMLEAELVVRQSCVRTTG